MAKALNLFVCFCLLIPECIPSANLYTWNLLMQTPVHTIASNAGVEGAVVVGKLLEQDNPDLGYDAAKGPNLDCHILSNNMMFCFLLIP